MTHEIGLSVAWLDGALVVSGEIDHASCDVLKRAIHAHLEGGNRRLTLDLSGVSFCDSACVACLLDPVRDGIEVVIRRPSAAVRKVLAIVGADQLLTIED